MMIPSMMEAPWLAREDDDAFSPHFLDEVWPVTARYASQKSRSTIVPNRSGIILLILRMYTPISDDSILTGLTES